VGGYAANLFRFHDGKATQVRIRELREFVSATFSAIAMAHCGLAPKAEVFSARTVLTLRIT
jgi:hypothetical protein